MLELIATYLEAQGLGQVGTSIFVDAGPIETTGLMLKSNPLGDPVDKDLPGFIRGSFTAIARADTYSAAKDLVERAVATLGQGTKHRLQLGGIDFRSIVPRTKPFTFPPAQGQAREFAVVLDVVYVDA